MEWAESIGAREGRLVASIVDSKGGRRLADLEELTTRGLPTAPSSNMRFRKVPLWQLQKADAAEYGGAFGFDPTHCDTSRHVVYSLEWTGRKWLVPALALLRGIFKPNRLILPAMFRPQALHHLCVPNVSGEGLVTVTAPWSASSRDRRTDPRPLLTWLACDERGQRTAGSVHEHAMRGQLGLVLPQVLGDVSVQGIAVGRSVFVTSFNVNCIYQDGLDDTIGPTSGRRVPLSCTRDPRSMRGIAYAQAAALRFDGAVKLSDAEWAAIEPMVRPVRRASRAVVDLRAIVNGVLARLAGAKWASLGESGIPSVHYLYYFRKWARTGLMQTLLDVLAELRTGSRPA